MIMKRFSRRHILAIGALLLLVAWWFSLPRPLFDRPLSLVMESADGQLIGARTAADGQWRFPPPDSLPEKFITCLTTFEDQRFFQHPGVDLRALIRAARQNIRAGRIVSGGSTLSMQVIRLAKHNPPRTIWQKMLEITQALRLELSYSKDEILRLWSTHAPFGGNVVGLEAATWRYFGKPPSHLSWGEAATLAVLPNSPALIHPGRNRATLEAKRNRLLTRLVEAGLLDSLSGQLAQAEALPAAPLALPQLAPHLLDRLRREKGSGRYQVSLDMGLQRKLLDISRFQHQRLAQNGINNLAILVVDIESGQTLGYVGNVAGIAPEHSPAVDLIRAPRSPGSLLKPLLYGLALQQGRILPQSLLPDVPLTVNGFRPENFHQKYVGAVPAQQALARSLNIPFVHLLQDFGVPAFHHALQRWQFADIRFAPDHYGLALILGGCEVNLWQTVGWYASMGRMLRHYYPNQGQYAASDWRLPTYLSSPSPTPTLRAQPELLGAGAAWFTLQAMEQLERPDSEGEWERFRSSRRLAWKTGTSYGFRDAWAVGLDARYAIGVWVGNADGEGRPGLVGVQAAAPILFAVVNSLPAAQSAWFEQPYDDCRQSTVCRDSGFRALPICPVDTVWMPKAGLSAPACPYHTRIHTDAEARWRINRDCATASELFSRSWFQLPPLQAHYYRQHHPGYRPLPPWRADCEPAHNSDQPMALIYPRQPSRIKVPLDFDGQPSATVFTVTHQQSNAQIHWHLDDLYLGATHQFHTQELRPPPGDHVLLLVDEAGNRLEQRFSIVE